MFAETGMAEVRVIENPLKEAEQLPNPDLVVFTGGSDVTPWLYGKANVASANNLNRDIREVLWYHRFYNTHKVGICRGGQFLFTMDGGVMDQDILGHGLSHELVFPNWTPPKGIGRSVTSTHHQHMAVPSPQQIVLATAAHDGKNEIILNQSTNSLSFQPHPEYQNDECKELFFWYLKCSGTGAGQVEGGWGYLDGSAMVTATTALESGTDGAVALLILGGVISAHLRGQLGALRQWTAALSAAELENERYQIYASRRDNLIGEYPLWDVATSLTDFSGNGATLTNLSGFGGTAPSDTAHGFPVRIGARRAGRGVAVAPITVATLSAPTATSVTATTATLGATTDQTSGTLYAVVDTAANLSGVTATEIKAGQKAGGAAALASANSAVSTTTPSAGVTGLSPYTIYSYAMVQNNANGDSNVLTGDFATGLNVAWFRA